jgi:hypothetical protein
MIDPVGFRYMVMGNRMDSVAPGPRPGRTPTNVPKKQPRKQYTRLWISNTLAKP